LTVSAAFIKSVFEGELLKCGNPLKNPLFVKKNNILCRFVENVLNVNL
jgi:hypothetical protein